MTAIMCAIGWLILLAIAVGVIGGAFRGDWQRIKRALRW